MEFLKQLMCVSLCSYIQGEMQWYNIPDTNYWGRSSKSLLRPRSFTGRLPSPVTYPSFLSTMPTGLLDNLIFIYQIW